MSALNLLRSQSCVVSMSLTREESCQRAAICLANADLEQLCSASPLFLDERELVTAARLRHPRRHLSYVLGRYCAKRALAQMTTLTLRSHSIQSGIFGQPVIEIPGVLQGWQASISHTANLGAAVAFPEGQPLALDIEIIGPESAKTLAAETSIEERQQLDKLGLPDASGLTMLWTVKEALSKVLRTGLTTSFDIFTTSAIVLAPNGWFVSFYENFFQYKCHSYICLPYVLSLLTPRKTEVGALHSVASSLETLTSTSIFSSPGNLDGHKPIA